MSPREPRGRRVFRIPFSKRALRDDVDAELRFHIEGRIDELMSKGLSREQAERVASERFGDIDAHRRAMHAIDDEIRRTNRRRDLMDSLRREVKQALRALSRAPSFTA